MGYMESVPRCEPSTYQPISRGAEYVEGDGGAGACVGKTSTEVFSIIVVSELVR